MSDHEDNESVHSNPANRTELLAPIEGNRFDDLEAVTDECNYIKRVLGNFKNQLHNENLHADVRSMLIGFRSEVAAIVTDPVRNEQLKLTEGTSSGEGEASQGATQIEQKPAIVTSSPIQCKVANLIPTVATGGDPNASTFTACCPDASASKRVDESINLLVNALSNLDHRPVPSPEIFNPESGQSFNDFLLAFENYCESNFRGDKNLWGSQLGKFLDGELRDAYTALRVPGEPYGDLKRKLTDWLLSSKDKMEFEAKQKFKNARRATDERIRLYGARLQKYFQVAYPKRAIEGSKVLREKFIDTVPWRFKDRILTAQSVRLSMEEEELGFSKILAMASQYDARDFSKDKSGEECMNVEQSERESESRGMKEVRDAPRRSEGNSDGRGFSSSKYSPSRPKYTDLECFYCKTVGHVRKDCRRLKNQCLVCGSDKHKVSDCPDRRSSGWDYRRGGYDSRRSEIYRKRGSGSDEYRRSGMNDYRRSGKEEDRRSGFDNRSEHRQDRETGDQPRLN